MCVDVLLVMTVAVVVVAVSRARDLLLYTESDTVTVSIL